MNFDEPPEAQCLLWMGTFMHMMLVRNSYLIILKIKQGHFHFTLKSKI